ncbi:prepilin-type N-terminal cleavage/methylation domain-containing protein [Ligilactobacillus equi]|uniref:ComG operon protein 3 n=2 Tax=Ligilactobacillus equi TaxID=137357 RepID=V7HXS9_9LACO|nr:competence type IV pilus major pilin ComGC [Ligilactobacillus equi]ETA74008.1 ComG operon protein 3 [Ligilactobacillus equi DPC 6820]MCQ2556794.1 prepilin-type N-terminal cleavage/methylation domain-containing protein [Ligilactobacillus sp.]
MKKISKKMSAFTLIEMAIVLFIISLLLLLVIPNISHQKDHANKVNMQALNQQFSTQKQLYEEEHPTATNVTVKQLVDEQYLTSEQGEKLTGSHAE